MCVFVCSWVVGPAMARRPSDPAVPARYAKRSKIMDFKRKSPEKSHRENVGTPEHEQEGVLFSICWTARAFEKEHFIVSLDFPSH